MKKLLGKVLDSGIVWHVRQVDLCFYSYRKTPSLGEGERSCEHSGRLSLLCGAARRSFTKSIHVVAVLPLPRAAAAMKHPPSRVPFPAVPEVQCTAAASSSSPGNLWLLDLGSLLKYLVWSYMLNQVWNCSAGYNRSRKPLILNGISGSLAVSSPQEVVLWTPSGAREAQGVGALLPLAGSEEPLGSLGEPEQSWLQQCPPQSCMCRKRQRFLSLAETLVLKCCQSRCLCRRCWDPPAPCSWNCFYFSFLARQCSPLRNKALTDGLLSRAVLGLDRITLALGIPIYLQKDLKKWILVYMCVLPNIWAFRYILCNIT